MEIVRFAYRRCDESIFNCNYTYEIAVKFPIADKMRYLYSDVISFFHSIQNRIQNRIKNINSNVYFEHLLNRKFNALFALSVILV